MFFNEQALPGSCKKWNKVGQKNPCIQVLQVTRNDIHAKAQELTLVNKKFLDDEYIIHK